MACDGIATPVLGAAAGLAELWRFVLRGVMQNANLCWYSENLCRAAGETRATAARGQATAWSLLSDNGVSMPSCPVRHPVFARLWSLMSRHEPAEIRRHRDELLTGLAGRVIEVGAGAGSNFAHYPATVEQVVAVEPEPYLRERAHAAAARADVRIEVLDGVADHLPAEDASFDAAVACLVLCTVPDQARALAELRRVLRPRGELRFYEHVLSERPEVALSQRAVDRLFWPRAFGGCHTARDTPAAIAAAGFEVDYQRRMWVNPVPIAFPVASHAIGRARRS